MHKRRYELTDFEWSIIEPLLPNKPRGVDRAEDGVALGPHFRAVWSCDDLLQPVRQMAEDRRVGSDF